uniref:DNA 5'-3' helicase n=1 Tax=Strigamia maritima TaxID=126957 RepID=T1J6D5_STRMM
IYDVSCNGCDSTLKKDGNESAFVDLTQDSIGYDDDDDFEVVKKKTRQVQKTPSSVPVSTQNKCPAKQQPQQQHQQPPKKRVLPKIYFGTRTHKQIEQLIRELAKTAYADVNMDILGSRDHTCVHPVVSKSGNKNELCQQLLDPKKGEGCGYFTGASKVYSYQTIRNQGLRTAWDLEDLVGVGKKSRMCPYYLTRTLKDLSDIVFCPYNYIIDPLIRGNMEINLCENVLIFDEAHNMEDSARSAASFSVTQLELKAAIDDLHNVAESGHLASSHKALGAKLGQLMDWILKQDAMLAGSEEPSKSLTGVSFVAVLNHLGLGSEDYDEFTKLVHDVRGVDLDQKAKEEIEVLLSAATSMLLSSFTLVLGHLFKDKFAFVDDYRAVVSKSFSNISEAPSASGWISKSKLNAKGWVYTMKLWCLNPAVAFSDFRNDVHNIILTSGTLSPMDTFESELDVPFKIKFEANHVINSNQVWIGSVAQSDEVALNGCFRNTESLEYQDAIGNLVHRVCRVTPHGVLCFFPSYKLLEKLSTRWQDTGIWDQMAQFKTVLSEPRSNLNNEFENMLTEFYSAVDETGEDLSENQFTGALLLAVCRGKVSEGLDFSDKYARAVITIGIPFSNVGAIDVILKRNYNDANRRTRNILSGAQWYEIQAFRALNQALGRCIRHRNDWGALILVDDRFGKQEKYVNGLSKWVRKAIKVFPLCNNAMTSLEKFMLQRTGSSPAMNVSNFNSPLIKSPDVIIQPSKRVLPLSLKQMNTPETSFSSRQLQVSTPKSASTSQITLPVFFANQVVNKSAGSVLKRSLFKREIKEEVEILVDEQNTDYDVNKLKRKSEEVNSGGQKKTQRIKSASGLGMIVCNKCRRQMLDGENAYVFPNGPVALLPYVITESTFLMTLSDNSCLKPMNTSGQLLNALFNSEDGCCFQVQVCSGCQQISAFKVVSTLVESSFDVGQTWFLPRSIELVQQ